MPLEVTNNYSKTFRNQEVKTVQNWFLAVAANISFSKNAADLKQKTPRDKNDGRLVGEWQASNRHGAKSCASTPTLWRPYF